MLKIFITLTFFSFFMFCTRSPELEISQKPFPIGLCLTQEMEFITEIDTWDACEDTAYQSEKDSLVQDWRKKVSSFEPFINAETVKSLSLWAKKEMETYDSMPSLKDIEFIPIHISDRGKVVYESTVDTLPTHSPIVTRWLKVYILYNAFSHSIVKTTITIRGQILE